MGKIIIKNGFFKFEEIKKKIPLGISDYEQSTLQFCQDWLSGKEQFVLQTSGSTGIPKSILLNRSQMEASALATAEKLGLKAGDTALVCLNTSYIAGIMMLVRGMVVDMNLIIVPPTSSPLKDLPANVSIDFIAMVPLQLQTMLEENDSNALKQLNSLKALLIGGAAVSVALEAKIQILKAPVFSSYGMTETVSHIALRRLNGNKKQNNYDVLSGISIDVDERGCLKIYGAVTNHEWVQTNDLVELINPTTFNWLGRADATINSGGIKIQPEKIEKAIESILSEYGFQNYFVGALPHSALGEAITLFIESEECSSVEILDSIKLILNRFELPKAIVFHSAFPRTITGKIDKQKILEFYKQFYL